MADPRVDLFCEDAGHELFSRALIALLGREAGLRLQIDTRSAMGGHGRVILELEAYQQTIRREYLSHPVPDLLVVVIDANRLGAERERLVRGKIDASIFPRSVVGCPDPYVERWCFADLEGFASVIGMPPPGESRASSRDSYKQLLETALTEAGQTIATTPMEFAPDLVEAMDLFRAGKNQPALKRFVDDLRAQLGAIAQSTR